MAVVPFSGPKPQQQLPDVDPSFLQMAGAVIHEEQQSYVGSPMDIRSGAARRDAQKSANDWPEGTSSTVRKTYNNLLKDGSITPEQYNKAMRDPRQIGDF